MGLVLNGEKAGTVVKSMAMEGTRQDFPVMQGLQCSWKQQWDQEKLQTDSQLPPPPATHTHTEMEKQDSSLSAGYELRTVFDIFYPSYLSDSLCKTSFDISGNCSSEKLGNVPRVTQPVNDWDRIDSKSTILFTLYEPFYITCDSTFQ